MTRTVYLIERKPARRGWRAYTVMQGYAATRRFMTERRRHNAWTGTKWRMVPFDRRKE